MWCFVLPFFDGVIMDGHPIFQLRWMPATSLSHQPSTVNFGQTYHRDCRNFMLSVQWANPLGINTPPSECYK